MENPPPERHSLDNFHSHSIFLWRASREGKPRHLQSESLPRPPRNSTRFYSHLRAQGCHLVRAPVGDVKKTQLPGREKKNTHKNQPETWNCHVLNFFWEDLCFVKKMFASPVLYGFVGSGKKKTIVLLYTFSGAKEATVFRGGDFPMVSYPFIHPLSLPRAWTRWLPLQPEICRVDAILAHWVSWISHWVGSIRIPHHVVTCYTKTMSSIVNVYNTGKMQSSFHTSKFMPYLVAPKIHQKTKPIPNQQTEQPSLHVETPWFPLGCNSPHWSVATSIAHGIPCDRNVFFYISFIGMVPYDSSSMFFIFPLHAEYCWWLERIDTHSKTCSHTPAVPPKLLLARIFSKETGALVIDRGKTVTTTST